MFFSSTQRRASSHMDHIASAGSTAVLLRTRFRLLSQTTRQRQEMTHWQLLSQPTMMWFVLYL